MSIPAPRYDIRIPFKLTSTHPVGCFQVTSENISRTGMLVSSTTLRPRGTVIEFESDHFNGTAEVIWTRETEGEEKLLGMSFVSLSRREHKLLEALLEAPEPAS